MKTECQGQRQFRTVHYYTQFEMLAILIPDILDFHPLYVSIGVDYDPIRDLDDRMERRNQFNTGTYVKESFWGVIGHETDQHGDDNDTPDEILELARRHLLDPIFDNYLYLNAVDEYMHNPAENS